MKSTTRFLLLLLTIGLVLSDNLVYCQYSERALSEVEDGSDALSPEPPIPKYTPYDKDGDFRIPHEPRSITDALRYYQQYPMAYHRFLGTSTVSIFKSDLLDSIKKVVKTFIFVVVMWI